MARRRGARGGVDRRSDSDNATSVDVEIGRIIIMIMIAAVLAAARPTLLFRPFTDKL